MKVASLKENMNRQDVEGGTTKTRMAWQKDLDSGDVSRHCKKLEGMMKVLRQLKFAMAIFGIYNIRNKEADTEKQNRKRLFPTKAAIYNLFVFVLLWISVVKMLLAWVAFDNGLDQPLLRVIPIAFGLQVAVNATILLKTSHPRFGYSEQACTTWNEKIVPLLEDLRLDLNPRKSRRKMLLIVSAGLMGVIMGLLSTAFPLLYPHTSMYTIIPQLIISPLPINLLTKMIMMPILLYMYVAWILPMVYTILICTFLNFGFKACSEAVEQAIKETKEQSVYPGCMYRQRLLHLNLCKIVELFDKDLKHLFANTCFTSIPLTVLSLYQLLKGENDSISMAIFIFCFASWFSTMMITCAYAATVNKAAHSPINHIYETGLKGVSLDQLGQINFFVSKLTASPIGFSILDFVVITKELLLTVGGIFLTYAFVLLQF